MNKSPLTAAAQVAPVPGNCPLCRAPMRSPRNPDGRSATCFSGHEVNMKSILPGVLPTIPGWLCWHTKSNSGISVVRYDFWGEHAFDQMPSDENFAEDLIDRYEDWMKYASHGATIEWEVNCAVPKHVLEQEIERLRKRVDSTLSTVNTLLGQQLKYYPENAS